MRQILQYELDGTRCELFETTAATTLIVEEGTLWLTVENRPDDYWLSTGESMELAAGQRLWLGAESGKLRLRTIVERPLPVSPGHASDHAPAPLRMASGAFRTVMHRLTGHGTHAA